MITELSKQIHNIAAHIIRLKAPISSVRTFALDSVMFSHSIIYYIMDRLFNVYFAKTCVHFM